MTDNSERQPSEARDGVVKHGPAGSSMGKRYSVGDWLLLAVKLIIWLFFAVLTLLLTITVLGDYANRAVGIPSVVISAVLSIFAILSIRRTGVFAVFMVPQMLLLAVSIPFILEPSRRDFVARAMSDLQGMSIAMESFALDQNGYPTWTREPERKVPFTGGADMPTFCRFFPGGPATLTNPVAYTTSYPLKDYFSIGGKPQKEETLGSYAYWAPEKGGWILISPGPDRRFDLDWPTLQKAYDPTASDPAAGLIPYAYDPTNGTESRGDLWVIKP